MRFVRREALLVAAAYAAASLVAAGAAFGLRVGAHGPLVIVSNHCTRYAPVVTQDYNCYVYGDLTNTGDWGYRTPSVALRDANGFSNGSSTTWYALGYDGGNNYPTPWIRGYGSSIGSSNGYAKAKCGSLYYVQGVCWTTWHD